MGLMLLLGGESNYDKALKAAKKPDMTLKNNPLVNSDSFETCPCHQPVVGYNMRRLERDAELRNDPVHGAVYKGIMSTRYGG